MLLVEILKLREIVPMLGNIVHISEVYGVKYLFNTDIIYVSGTIIMPDWSEI